MFQLDPRKVEAYLADLLDADVRLVRTAVLGEAPRGERALKSYGYGTPIRLDYLVNGQPRSAVLETVSPGPFGHEHMADRAQILLWSHDASNRLPRHVRSLDVGAFTHGDDLRSLGSTRELFLLNEYVDGTEYVRDLERLRDGGALADADIARADALCDYLVQIHSVRVTTSDLYVRRVRELIGGNECIMGVADAYPETCDEVRPGEIQAIEQSCVRWRWRLSPRTHRLCQVHGDFHPWNILFREGTDFTVLDRSRGEWGDSADDVTSLTTNYLFFALQSSERFDGPLRELFQRFWTRYLAASGDREILEVAAPFFAFRGLVMANPIWYPTLPPGVRRAILTFVEAVLEVPSFDPDRAADYCRLDAPAHASRDTS
jgi:hypothetical protein